MYKLTSSLSRLQRMSSVLSNVMPVDAAPCQQMVKLQAGGCRYMSGSAKTNTMFCFVPQQQAWVVEKFGKFHRILEPGFNVLIPVMHTIRYVQILKEIVLDIDEQSAITADNVTLDITAVLFVKVTDPYKASYGVDDAEKAIRQLAQTNMRSEIGKITLDSVFRERESLNIKIVDMINKASESWGLDCKRYEIRDVRIPKRVNEAMQLQVEAERKKRAAILESEGVRTAEINIAEGQKMARILKSEADKTEQINHAVGEADAMLAVAKAKAEALNNVAAALHSKDGQGAASLKIAEQYIDAFGQLAKQGNTLILPSNTGDVTSMVAQAMSIYSTMHPGNQGVGQSHQGEPLEVEGGQHSIDSPQDTDKPSS